MFKRGLDIALAGSALAIALPLIAFVAILIKLDSPGPAFFRQTRMGRGFRTFKLLKLRTMHAAPGGSSYTLGADPRITRTGRWLRWLKFDELPQLWNVVRGEMSLVGPRPVIPELTVEFRRPYKRLLQVRPGLTDPATLKYCREAEALAHVTNPLEYFKTVVTPDKLRISCAYMRRANTWRDLGVIVQTVVALLPSWRLQAGPFASNQPRRAQPPLYFSRSGIKRVTQPRFHGVPAAVGLQAVAKTAPARFSGRP